MTTKTWNGSTADWYFNSGGDWTPPGDPGSGDAVVINSGEAQLLSGDAAISVASISITGGLLAIQDPSVTQSVSGNVSVTGNGSVSLDGGNLGGAGGSSLTIGGSLTNSSTNGSGVDVGNTNITSADTLTVNGAGGLSNTGAINIEGSATVQATLNVADDAAGFGTAGVETGNVFLQNDALLEFKSGQITTVDGQLWLDGANSRVADAGTLGSNSALTGLATVAGNFFLQNGATVAPTGALSVTGNGSVSLDGGNLGGAGGSSLTIGGSLTNSSTNGSGVDVGNTNITSADTLTVNGAGGLSNTGAINIEGSATVQATLNVADDAAGFGTAGVETGNVFLQNNALLEFKSGQITTVDGQLWLDGANSRVADAGTLGSNSALTGLATVAGNFFLQNGATVAPTGALSVTGNGSVSLDGGNLGGAGGSSLTIGGSLTNSSTNGSGVDVGNTNITSADTLTVNGAGGLSNTGAINIEGSATVQATLNVADDAAGFGTAGVETGNVFLQNNALLEFKSGQITTVDGQLWLDGANSRVADAGTLGSNSALTGLATVAGNFFLQNGATVAPTGALSVTGNGSVSLDGGNLGGAGGSSLTIGGSLTNSSTNGSGVDVGNTNITSADTLTVNGAGGLSNTGTINIEGSATVQATLNVADDAAGFGTAGVETGNVFLQNNALLEFKSGQITTVDGQLWLDGANSRVADAGTLGSNSALTGLATVAGNFFLQNGATVAPTGALSVTGNGSVSLDGGNLGGAGGSSLTIGGSLTNSSTNGSGVDVGNTNITSADTLTVNGAGGLSNTGTINIEGSATVQATLNVADDAAGFGTAGVETGNVFLQNDALLEFKSGQITTVDGQLWLDGANSRVARAAALTTNSALTGLTTVSRNFWLENGAKVSPTGNVSVTGNGTLGLDGNNTGGAGGSSLTIGGTLTNSSTNGNGISIGTANITSADTLTVKGTGGLSNGSSSRINIEGSATVQATLNVADAAAGFGTAGVETGEVFLQNDALLEFKSGQITTVDGTLWLDGANSRVARAAALTTNSALTGLTTISGNFWLENGAKVSPTGNVSVTGNGTLGLDGNNTGGAGGSSLTIGGTLTNSSTNGNGISIGTANITSADTLTVKGTGGLSNTGDINIEGGSASATANLVVTNDVTSSAGTIFLNSFGDLTASAVNITGGILEGTGTVTGALNDTGGTVVGGSFDGNTGTLKVSGAYTQSGTGILQTDINTGDSQQSSTINVTGTPGTPGVSGSVNLAGGTLLIDGESSLALNTPYTVMTFGANDLYGQFARVETEGSLGSHTGNSNSVNLGDGDTLEVLYNEASGDVQVELVSTPASTTYTWDVGSGTWNASSGADWNPPGNGTMPSNTSNVTIGTGGGGTVTLAQDQTIASLSVTSGYTLSGSSKSISTTGNVSLAGGATLSIDDMNVGGTFTDSGSATFAGVLTINGAGQLLLSNGSITGGINGTGTFESVSGTTDTLSNVTIYKGTTFTTTSGATTDISGAISNRGAFVIDGTSGDAIVNLAANVTLSGGGAVTLKTKSGTAFLRGSGVTLTNTNDTIQGAGNIGDSGALAIVNQGTFDANGSGQGLNVNQGNGGVTNTGTLEATNGGTLNLFNTITNTGGAITASGTGSTVNVDNATVIGGTLNTASGGVVETLGTSTLNGVTISSSSTYTTADATTDLNTSLVNDGTFLIDGSAGDAIVNLGSNVTLSGGGTVAMKTGSGPAFLRGSGFTLTNTNDTIQGSGNIGDSGALTIVNQATIDANVSGGGLNLNQGNGGVTNTGTLEATNSGTLNLFNTITNKAAGVVTANGGTVNVVGTISGGTLNTLNSGVMETSRGGAALSGVTISSGSTYTAGPGTTTQLNGAIVNDGTFAINGATGDAIVNLGSAVTLSGGGKVTMASGTGGSAFLRGSSLMLTNTNNTIQGAGNIGDSGALTLVNQATIDANASGMDLNLNGGNGGVTNTGTLEATSGGTLQLFNKITNTSGVVTANGGTVNVVGTISGGTLNTLNSGVMETSGSSANLSGVTISSGSTYTAGPGTTTQLNGAIVNDGTFAINGATGDAIVNLGSAVTLSGGGKVTMASGTGGSAFLRGSSLKLTNSNDTIQGSGFIGDSGALALVNKGTIDANSKGQNLNLNQGNGGVTNTKALEATAGGVLQLFNKITNTGGAITASGTGSTVNVNATIVGGTLNTTGGGLMETVSSADLNGVTISTGSTYTTGGGATTQLDSSLVNEGTFLIDGSASNAIVNVGSSLTLSGGGAVTMKSKTGSAFLRGNGVTLTNTNNTIQGAGNIGDSGALALDNEATIDANVSTSGLSLNVNGGNGGVTNTGTLEATGGGVLQLFDTITNTGGAITASGTNSVVNVENATIVGGTLNTASGGLMQTVGSSSALNGVTISSGSTYTAGPGTTTQLNGAIVNDGTFAINGASGNAIVNLGSAVTLPGGGTVTMSSGASGNAFLRGNGLTLTNTNDTIQGAGLIGDSGALAIDNKGTIDANSSGQSLNLGQGGGALTNTGTFEATGGGHLFVAGALGGAGQLKVGASSEVELGGNTSENTTFLSATAAKLRIDNATTTTYGGVLNSFAKGDILELGNTNATTATPTSFNGTDTTLTVDLSSGGPLLYSLAGNLTADTFSVTHSGSDSDIAIATTAAFEQAFSLLGNPMGSSFVSSSSVFGASNVADAASSAQVNLVASLHAHS